MLWRGCLPSATMSPFVDNWCLPAPRFGPALTSPASQMSHPSPLSTRCWRAIGGWLWVLWLLGDAGFLPFPHPFLTARPPPPPPAAAIHHPHSHPLPCPVSFRIAVRPVRAGEFLLSWGLPFGRATKDILPGQYCCNRSIIDSLAVRHVGFPLPVEGNFEDVIQKHVLDEASFVAAEQVPARVRPTARFRARWSHTNPLSRLPHAPDPAPWRRHVFPGLQAPGWSWRGHAQLRGHHGADVRVQQV
jgi:hypothetical protein